MAARQALVKTAIVNLKLRKKGATLDQIRKQLLSSYTGKIDVNDRRLLTTTLRRLLHEGQLQKKGPNYNLARARLSAGDEDDEGVPSRRRSHGHHSGGSRSRHHRRRRHHGGRRRHHRRRRHHGAGRRHHGRRRHHGGRRTRRRR